MIDTEPKNCDNLSIVKPVLRSGGAELRRARGGWGYRNLYQKT